MWIKFIHVKLRVVKLKWKSSVSIKILALKISQEKKTETIFCFLFKTNDLIIKVNL